MGRVPELYTRQSDTFFSSDTPFSAGQGTQVMIGSLTRLRAFEAQLVIPGSSSPLPTDGADSGLKKKKKLDANVIDRDPDDQLFL